MGKRPAITISPVTATCGSLQYAATGLLSNGTTQDLTSTATWTSSSTSVATVDNKGLATGVGLGTTNIGASFKGVSATSEPLLVDQLNSIKVSPLTATVAQGASQSFLADGNFTFASGGSSDLDVSSQATWASSKPAVATIDNTGKATAVGPGSTTITATSCDGIAVGQATLTVGGVVATSLVITPATITISTGTTTLFTAMEKLSDGTTRATTNPVTWSSGTTSVATIDASSAVALGITAGPSTITATETISGLTGTATLTVQAAAARFAYIANGNSGSISGYTVDVAGGTFTPPIPGSPFPASGPQQVLIHPSGDFMYYIDFNGSLHVEDINSTNGSLTDSGQAAVPASSIPSANVGVIDPTGRFIYVISDAGNSIYGFSITQTANKAPATNGALTAIPTMTAYTDQTLSTPVWIMTDRTGKYLYVINDNTTTGNSISQYAIIQTGANAGALTQLSTTGKPTGSAPFYGTTDVNGHIFVANSGDNTVSVFSINSTGLLTQVGSNFPVATASTVFNVLTDPTGKYLYILDSPVTAGQVFAYNLNSSSTTNVIGSQIGTAQPTGSGPIGMAIDPTGALLAIDNNISNNISLFKVAAAGSTTPGPGGLTPANPPTVATDTNGAPHFVMFYTAASGQ
jgi:6-phosphogluconolactonase (cycloisomerase 2 family)